MSGWAKETVKARIETIERLVADERRGVDNHKRLIDEGRKRIAAHNAEIDELKLTLEKLG